MKKTLLMTLDTKKMSFRCRNILKQRNITTNKDIRDLIIVDPLYFHKIKNCGNITEQEIFNLAGLGDAFQYQYIHSEWFRNHSYTMIEEARIEIAKQLSEIISHYTKMRKLILRGKGVIV